jgi:hypothetical protein
MTDTGQPKKLLRVFGHVEPLGYARHSCKREVTKVAPRCKTSFEIISNNSFVGRFYVLHISLI